MRIQAQFDNECLNMLPLIKDIINKAEKFEKNQMINRTLGDCSNSYKPIAYMTEKELIKFQNGLIEVFRFHEWVRCGD
jgi:hypothetical protein